jgi:hypothetical protein
MCARTRDPNCWVLTHSAETTSASASLGIVSCERDGPIENADEEIDDAIDVDDVGDEIEEAVDEATDES